MPIFEVEPIPRREKALRFDGSNLDEVRSFLEQQQAVTKLTVLNGHAYPYIRRPDRPDEPLLPGNTILIDDEGWAHHVSGAVMERWYQKVD